MENIDVIFFDLFFTLVIPRYGDIEKDNEFYDLNITREYWETFAEDEELYYERASGKIKDSSDIIRNILGKCGICKDESEIKKIAEKRIKRFERSLSSIEDSVTKTLEFLCEKSKRMCLISNADVIDKIGWVNSPLNRYFEDAIFSCDVGVLKPDRKIYEIALNKMKIEPQRTVFIGDGGSQELFGAKSVGMNTILTRHFTRDILSQKGLKYADITIDCFEEIKNHIM